MTDEIILTQAINTIPINTRKWLKNMPPEERALVLQARKKMQRESAKRNAKLYHKRHPDRVNKQTRKWHRENADKIRDINREYKKNNPQKVKAMMDKWRTVPRNRMKSIISSRIAYAKQHGTEVNEIIMREFIDNPPTHCAITGIELDYSVGKTRSSSLSPSIDRINPQKGYIQGNVAAISWRMNTIKSFGTAEEHRLIANYMDKNNA